MSMHIKIYAIFKYFTCFLLILSDHSNGKINVYECLNWISQMALKMKGLGKAIRNDTRHNVFEM